MTKEVFKSMYSEVKKSGAPFGLVLESIGSHGGYSSGNTLLVTMAEDVKVTEQYIAVAVTNTSLVTVGKCNGVVMIPYSAVQYVIMNYMPVKK